MCFAICRESRIEDYQYRMTNSFNTMEQTNNNFILVQTKLVKANNYKKITTYIYIYLNSS